jgi:hypothetical protein
MIEKQQSGYILIFSMMFIAMIIALSMIISNRGSLHVNYAKFMISREKAKMLAYSGLQIAMAQLAIKEKKEEDAGKAEIGKDKSGARSSGDSKQLWTEKESKEFIKTVWPNMYKWQEFKLTEKNYGTDGIIKICIGAEEGKLDINQTFVFDEDQAKRKFVGQADIAEKKDSENDEQKDLKTEAKKSVKSSSDYKKLYENVFKKIDVFIKGANKFEKFEGYLKNKQRFEKILKNRQDMLYDTTEFFALDGFDGFADKIFYEPQEEVREKGKVLKAAETIYWNDIFTIFSGNKKISPWFISPSIKKLLGFKEPEIKSKADSISKKFKENLSYPKDWNDIFMPIFGIKYEDIPAWFKFAIDEKFEPRFFSVISYGKVDDVYHKIFAIIERKKEEINKKIVIKFEIKKFYCV